RLFPIMQVLVKIGTVEVCQLAFSIFPSRVIWPPIGILTFDDCGVETGQFTSRYRHRHAVTNDLMANENQQELMPSQVKQFYAQKRTPLKIKRFFNRFFRQSIDRLLDL